VFTSLLMNQSANTEIQLVGIEACRKKVFPNNDGPSFRTFNKWKAQGFLPYHKIGKRVFMDPRAVRAALDKQFKIEPTAI
jgi:hypothetical protein